MLLAFVGAAMIATAVFLSALHVALLVSPLALPGAAAAAVPRGVADADAAAYDSTSGVFSCGAAEPGSVYPKTLLFSYVNDDFCDCPDGSDEPGTSACAGVIPPPQQASVSFFCRNEAFEGRHVALSRVGDGLCDCCDGSDEAVGVCEDTCTALAAEVHEANRAQREIFEAGAKQRARWLGVAQESLAEHRTELDKARKLLTEAAESKAHAEEKAGAVNDREAAEKVARAVVAQQDAEVRLGLHRLSHSRLLELVVRLVRDADGGTAADVTTARVLELAGELSDIDCNATAAGCEPAVLSKDAAEDAQTAAAAQAAAEAAAAAAAAKEAEEAEEAEEVLLDGPSAPDGDVDGQDGAQEASTAEEREEVAEDDESEAEEDPDVARRRRLRERIALAFEDAEGFVLPEAAAFREKLVELDGSVNKLEKAVRDKEEVVDNVDYGPDDVWFAIRDACFDTQLHGYKWELCPLKQIKQDSTSVGKFKRWENDYTTMVFENGQRCWNGPERSAEIDLACGATSELVSMEEPSKCVYKGRFLTPLLCV